jgi:4-amino-4-deoxy-L-arabinose transferase-like glycosyltransferase
MRPLQRRLALVAIIALNLILRLTGVNWDDGHYLHPDERQIAFVVSHIAWPPSLEPRVALNPATSTLNPRFFAYGSLPLYLLAVTSNVAARLGEVGLSHGGPGPFGVFAQLSEASSFWSLNLVGRVLSSLFDTGTVVLLYVLGRRIVDAFGALVASGGYAVAALAVQQSHFYVVDPILTFFVVLATFLSYWLAQRPSAWRSLLLGVVLGATVATKASAAPLALVVVVAHLVTFDARARELRWIAPRAWLGVAGRLGVAGVVSLGAFVAFEPFAVLDFPTFLRDVGAQSAMVRGLADFPYTRQYTHTTPYLYWFVQLIAWQLAPPLGILACTGTLFACGRLLLHRRSPAWLYLCWLVPYLVLTGSFFPKFPRYMLPAVPFMLLAGAGMLAVWAHRRSGTRLAPILAATILGLSGLYVVAYEQVYRVPHTRVTASRWIYQHVVPGAVLVHEHWDDPLPLPLDNAPSALQPGSYASLTLQIYANDTPEKARAMADMLARGDEVVISSNIVRGSVLRVPERYPMMRRYYGALFSGALGYKLVASFTSYPSLFGLTIDDSRADLNWSYYDHPPVWIFQNTAHLSAAAIEQVIGVPLAMGEPLPQQCYGTPATIQAGIPTPYNAHDSDATIACAQEFVVVAQPSPPPGAPS